MLRPCSPSVWIRRPLWGLALGLALAASAQPSRAQSGEVESEPLTDLTFPTIISGGAETVVPADAGAAKFRVFRSGGASSPLVSITFTLPSALQAGSDSLPVAFGTSSAAWADQDGGAMTTFDPSQGLTLNVPADDDFYVWLGGTATSASGQASGTYANPITLIITEL